MTKREEQPLGYVLDAWAVMAYLDGEPAGASVERLILSAHASNSPLWMSVVNVAEVWYTFARETTAIEADEALAELKQLEIQFAEVTLDLALEAAGFKARHKLSLADALAAALAKSKQIPLVTGDREFESLGKAIQLVWLKAPPAPK